MKQPRPDERIQVLLDGSPLSDGRKMAGIGRYIRGIGAGLNELKALDVRIVVPRPPPKDTWMVRYIAAQPALAVAAVCSRPSLVHACASEPILAWPLRRQVVTVHDVIPWTKRPDEIGLKTHRYLAIQRRRMSSVAGVVAVSAGVAHDVSAAFGVPEHRIHIIPNGVGFPFSDRSVPEDASLRSAAGVGHRPFVLWVGSLRHHDPRKNVDTVIAAAAALRGEVDLVLAGVGGDESARVMDLADRLRTRVIFTGFVPDEALAALYRGAVAVLVPSSDEGFGLPALEAMACGTPVVTTRGTNTAAVARGACLLVNRKNPQDLADATRSLLTETDLAAGLREGGIARSKLFSWRTAAESTVCAYRHVIRAAEWKRT